MRDSACSTPRAGAAAGDGRRALRVTLRAVKPKCASLGLQLAQSVYHSMRCDIIHLPTAGLIQENWVRQGGGWVHGQRGHWWGRMDPREDGQCPFEEPRAAGPPQEEAVSLWISLKPVSITLQYVCSPVLKQRIKIMVWRPWGRCGGISLQGEILVSCFQFNGTARIVNNPRTGRALWCLSSASAVLGEEERLWGPGVLDRHVTSRAAYFVLGSEEEPGASRGSVKASQLPNPTGFHFVSVFLGTGQGVVLTPASRQVVLAGLHRTLMSLHAGSEPCYCRDHASAVNHVQSGLSR